MIKWLFPSVPSLTTFCLSDETRTSYLLQGVESAWDSVGRRKPQSQIQTSQAQASASLSANQGPAPGAAASSLAGSKPQEVREPAEGESPRGAEAMLDVPQRGNNVSSVIVTTQLMHDYSSPEIFLIFCPIYPVKSVDLYSSWPEFLVIRSAKLLWWSLKTACLWRGLCPGSGVVSGRHVSSDRGGAGVSAVVYQGPTSWFGWRFPAGMPEGIQLQLRAGHQWHPGGPVSSQPGQTGPNHATVTPDTEIYA